MTSKLSTDDGSQALTHKVAKRVPREEDTRCPLVWGFSGYYMEILTLDNSEFRIWKVPYSLHDKYHFCRFRKSVAHNSRYKILPNCPYFSMVIKIRYPVVRSFLICYPVIRSFLICYPVVRSFLICYPVVRSFLICYPVVRSFLISV